MNQSSVQHPPFEFEGLRVAIVGMARSGLAAAEVLAARGARVTLVDGKPAEELVAALAWAHEREIPALAGTQSVGDVELVVTSPGVRWDAPILEDAHRRGIPVWGEIEAAYRIARAPIAAVTGTNGKTTTVLLLAAMLRELGIETWAAGNIAAGDLAMPLVRAAQEAPPDAVIAAEISSFQLETICKFRPKVAAILNITPDHEDRQTWDEYVAAKGRIFENQQADDFAVLTRRVPFTSGKGARLRGQVIYFDEVDRPEWLERLALPGTHNQENALAAACMARALGASEAAIAAVATTWTGVVHRLEPAGDVDGVYYVNNSMCTNTAAFARSLEALPGPKIVLAGGVFKGTDPSPLAQAVAGEDIRRVILFGRSAPLLAEAMRVGGVANAERVETLQEALAWAHSLAQPGDTVVLNPGCASFDQFRDFEDRGETFKRLVRELKSGSPPFLRRG